MSRNMSLLGLPARAGHSEVCQSGNLEVALVVILHCHWRALKEQPIT